MPKVLNKRVDGVPEGAVYIGRPSKWGNPYEIGKDGSRDEVIAKFKNYLLLAGPVDQLSELRGKDLVCWCAPQACHGDVLLDLANRFPDLIPHTSLPDCGCSECSELRSFSNSQPSN